MLLAADRVGAGSLLIAPGRSTLNDTTLKNSIRIANLHAPPGDGFTVTRARNTWLVRYLAAGTPLTVVMANAGLTTTYTLEDLLRFVPATDHDRPPGHRAVGAAPWPTFVDPS